MLILTVKPNGKEAFADGEGTFRLNDSVKDLSQTLCFGTNLLKESMFIISLLKTNVGFESSIVLVHGHFPL